MSTSEVKNVVVSEKESWQDSDFLSFDAPREDDDDEESSHDQNGNSRNGEQISSLRDSESLPPWMDQPHRFKFHRNIPKLVLLHDEIVSFAKLMEPRPEELLKRKKLIDHVKEVVDRVFPGSKTQVFGSTATGLIMPHSDVDFVVSLPDDHYVSQSNRSSDLNDLQRNELSNKEQKLKEKKEMDDYDVSHPRSSLPSPLLVLSEALRETWGGDLIYSEVVENTTVPIIKFTHGPTRLSGDVCFNQDYGPMAADLVKRFMDAMPPLKPLTYVLKYFMVARGLNEPYTGGCGSFMIQMMIISFLQHRERKAFNERRENTMNLGAILLEFFEFYSMDFNYLTTGISVRSDGFFFMKGAKGRRDHFYQPSRPFSLAIENPLDITQDVGRSSFRMQLISKSFEIAMRVLLSHTAEPVVETESILASIIPPTDDMRERAASKRRCSMKIPHSSQTDQKKRKNL